jgi:hypothetical protein
MLLCFTLSTSEDHNQTRPMPQHPRHIPRTTALLAAILCALLTCVAPPARAFDKARKAPPAKPASQYVASDTHASEKVTIAADPCLDVRDCNFFRLPYVSHGFIPVRVIITNDGETALSLEEVRIQFLSANGDKIPAASLDDLNRRLFTMRSTQGTKIPLIPITIHHPPVDKKVTDDDNDFGFQGTVVNAHSTLAGYLFYDVKELDDPALKNAELYIKMIHTLDKKKELFDFTIPFNKWLAANPDQKPAKQASPGPSTKDTE